MSNPRKMSPIRRGGSDKEQVYNPHPRRKQVEQEEREFRLGPAPRSFDGRRSFRGGGGFRGGKPHSGWKDRRRDERRPRTDQGFIYHDSRGLGGKQHRDRGVRVASDNASRGLGDHCKDISGSRDMGNREETFNLDSQVNVQGHELTKHTEQGIDVRSDLKKEIVKIKKALNLSGDNTVESEEFVGGGLSIKRQAADDLEESKPKKKKKKRKSKAKVKAAAAAAAQTEKKENIESKDMTMVKPPKEVSFLEKDNSLLRKKLQEILDENMKVKVDFQSLKRKWDDADSRIAKLEELARDKEAKIVELEQQNAQSVEKIEPKNRLIGDLEKENKITMEKLDSKRKIIRDLDDQMLAKDEKYEMIKKEISEKERHLTNLILVKDEMYKSKEVLSKENVKIKNMAKGISADSDILVKNFLEKEQLITELNKQLKEITDEKKIGENDTEIVAMNDVLVSNSLEIENLQKERDIAVQSNVELAGTVNDLKHQLIKEMESKANVPETTLSEKCDSSVAYDDIYDLDEDISLGIGNDLPDSLFEPLSDTLYPSDDDMEVLKITSTESPKEAFIAISEEKPNSSPKKSCPFKLDRIREYSVENVPEETSYKMYRRKLTNIEVSCINTIPGSTSRKMLLTLDDFARCFYPKLSVKRVGIILEQLDIPLYRGNMYQQEVLRKCKVDHIFNPIPLIMFEDVENNEDDLDSTFSHFLKDL